MADHRCHGKVATLKLDELDWQLLATRKFHELDEQRFYAMVVTIGGAFAPVMSSGNYIAYVEFRFQIHHV